MGRYFSLAIAICKVLQVRVGSSLIEFGPQDSRLVLVPA